MAPSHQRRVPARGRPTSLRRWVLAARTATAAVVRGWQGLKLGEEPRGWRAVSSPTPGRASAAERRRHAPASAITGVQAPGGPFTPQRSHAACIRAVPGSPGRASPIRTYATAGARQRASREQQAARWCVPAGLELAAVPLSPSARQRCCRMAPKRFSRRAHNALRPKAAAAAARCRCRLVPTCGSLPLLPRRLRQSSST